MITLSILDRTLVPEDLHLEKLLLWNCNDNVNSLTTLYIGCQLVAKVSVHNPKKNKKDFCPLIGESDLNFIDYAYIALLQPRHFSSFPLVWAFDDSFQGVVLPKLESAISEINSEVTSEMSFGMTTIVLAFPTFVLF